MDGDNNTHTVLVVDDEDDVREMIEEYLEGRGFVVRTAATAGGMMAIAEREPIDVILLDRTLPDGDGLARVGELRRRFRVPIILLTALCQEDERVRGLEAGADDYIGKPFHWRELAARIHAVLRRGNEDGGGSAGPEHAERRVAVVMSADVAAYTRLMNANEEATIREWWRHRRRTIDPAIAHHHGRVVKRTGDGFLAEFATVAAALACALDIQGGVAAANADVPPERRMQFRIGLNICPIIDDREDIHGDGVNLAARLQALAEPGGICVSEAVWRQAAGSGAMFNDLGLVSVHNLPSPVHVHQLLPETRAA